MIRCMDKKEDEKIMEDMHEGVFGTQSSGHTMAKNILKRVIIGLLWKLIASLF